MVMDQWCFGAVLYLLILELWPKVLLSTRIFQPQTLVALPDASHFAISRAFSNILPNQPKLTDFFPPKTFTCNEISSDFNNYIKNGFEFSCFRYRGAWFWVLQDGGQQWSFITLCKIGLYTSLGTDVGDLRYLGCVRLFQLILMCGCEDMHALSVHHSCMPHCWQGVI